MIAGARIVKVFAERAARAEGVLVTYLCAGFPDRQSSVAHALACVEGGADVLEIGVPFSDPTADGEAIARAAQRAIANGSGLEAALEVSRRVREKSEVPIVLFGYYNPIFVRGEERTARDAAAAGVDALLVVDLPPEEGAALAAHAHRVGVGVVPLVAPTSTDARLATLALLAPKPPFIYSVSVAGVTGSVRADLTEASRRAAAVRARTATPCVVGFGIGDADAAKKAAAHADGVVVGTALVRIVDDAVRDRLSLETQAERVRTFVRSLAVAVHAPRDTTSPSALTG